MEGNLEMLKLIFLAIISQQNKKFYGQIAVHV